jgi:hypothetical protein
MSQSNNVLTIVTEDKKEIRIYLNNLYVLNYKCGEMSYTILNGCVSNNTYLTDKNQIYIHLRKTLKKLFNRSK